MSPVFSRLVDLGLTIEGNVLLSSSLDIQLPDCPRLQTLKLRVEEHAAKDPQIQFLFPMPMLQHLSLDIADGITCDVMWGPGVAVPGLRSVSVRGCSRYGHLFLSPRLGATGLSKIEIGPVTYTDKSDFEFLHQWSTSLTSLLITDREAFVGTNCLALAELEALTELQLPWCHFGEAELEALFSKLPLQTLVVGG
jgi:hypothetical protein